LILFAVRHTTLIGSYGYDRGHLETLARLVATGRLDLSRSISATVPLEAAADGVEMLESKRGDPVRILVVP
jgi:threonine dehydrogenase-like Zn-dependent dehydrogenase